ncbi:hypothetical protein OIU77_006139 [Salix suchowensis]|uniref:Uncharacterized protein n=1 Tax=Salix suchowensis TaxID=1278906 RepID=A0ABQ9ARV7_9ROSI|nr:hypothetical protein OIU77_006139 [Salix suchowensis]
MFSNVDICDFDIFISSKCSLIVVTVLLWILLYMSGDFIWVCFGFYLNGKFDMIHSFT